MTVDSSPGLACWVAPSPSQHVDVLFVVSVGHRSNGCTKDSLDLIPDCGQQLVGQSGKFLFNGKGRPVIVCPLIRFDTLNELLKATF